MQGLATKNLLHALNSHPDDTPLAPEVEAPRDEVMGGSPVYPQGCEAGPFGAPPLGTDPMPERRDPELRPLFRWLLIPLCLAGLAAITLRDHELRTAQPLPPAAMVEPLAGSPMLKAQSLDPGQSYCIQDLREGECYWCAHRDHAGNQVGGYAC